MGWHRLAIRCLLELDSIEAPLLKRISGDTLDWGGYEIITALAEDHLSLGDSVILDSVARTYAIGALTFDAEFQTGARYRRDEVIHLALGGSTRIALQSTTLVVSSGLLPEREAEVARLVAGGLTNKQIGTRMLISERTVESHVRNIMNKLGVGSGAQIAAWITSAAER
jgi:DNA-binding NarL/FixJ family response regulator